MNRFFYILFSMLICTCFTNPGNAEQAQFRSETNPKQSISAQLAPWDQVNVEFRNFYASALKEKRKKFGPVIVCSGGDMILFRNGSCSVVNLIPEKYSFIKTIAHVPLAVFVALDQHCGEKLPESLLENLVSFKKKYEEAIKKKDHWILKKGSRESLDSMLSDSSKFIEKVAAAKMVNKKELDQFARSMSARVLESADEAVFYELGKTDNQIAKWKKDMQADEWDKLKVVVVSPHMPRQQNRQMLYFLKLFNEKEEGHRVVYMDGDPEQEEKALNLLAVHELDRDIAVSFFNDPWRMHRDLLGDAGKKFIKEHTLGKGGIEPVE